MDQVMSDVNVGSDDNTVSDSSTDVENQSITDDSLESDVENQDSDLPKSNDEGEQLNGKVPYNRFKSVVDEKNTAIQERDEALRRLAEFDEANKFKESNQQSEEKPKQDPSNFDIRQFDDLFSETKYNFKPANQYQSIEELFHDMKGAMLNEFFNVNDKLAERQAARQAETRQRINDEIEAVNQHFGADIETRDEFFGHVEKVMQETNSKPDLKSLLSIFQTMKKAGASSKEVEKQMSEDEAERQDTNRKINTKPNKSGKNSSPSMFNPSMHSDLSMDQLKDMYFKK